MVVLVPMLEGEVRRCCTRCGHIGIASPIRERSSFYPKHRRSGGERKFVAWATECRRCNIRLTVDSQQRRRARDAARYQANQRRYEQTWRERNRERKRRDDRERRARQKRASPEALRERERARQQRYQAKLRQDPERYEAAKAAARDRRRMNRQIELGLDREPVTLQGVPQGYVVKSLPIEPFRDWLNHLLVQIERDLANDPDPRPLATLASCVGMSTRRLYHYRRPDTTEVPETTVDWACTHEGSIHPAELYPEHFR